MTTQEKIRVFMDCGISQTKIAELAGINKSTLSKWMNGTRETVGEETQTALDAAMMDIAERLYNTVYEERVSSYQYDDIKLD